MSVINQMLKDLDERKDDRASHDIVSPTNVAVKTKGSGTQKLTLIVLVCILVVMLVYLLVDVFKTAEPTMQQIKQPITPVITTVVNKAAANKRQLEKDNTEVQQVESKVVEHVESSIQNIRQEIAAINVSNSTDETQTVVTDNVLSKNNLVVKIDDQELLVKVDEPVEVQQAKIEKPSLSISRAILTPEQLIEKKLLQAEIAKLNNEISVAESLYEDILLLQPKHIEAREQLAALWFGRQALGAAINVLSSGVSILPRHYSFRLMLARIFIQQGETEQAFQVLAQFVGDTDLDYQILLASTAQQTKHFDVAIRSYQTLLQRNAEQSAWWLGLGVSFDSNANFESAIMAYNKAIQLGDLSTSSRQFAITRIRILGE